MAEEMGMRSGRSTIRLVVERGRRDEAPAESRAHLRSDRIAAAVVVLHAEPASWFFQPRDLRGVFQADVLEALGRLEAPGRIRDAARALAAAPPMSGAEARRWIRAWTEASPGAEREVPGLLRVITRAVDAHRLVHRGATWGAVCQALEQALEIAEEAQAEEAAGPVAIPASS